MAPSGQKHLQDKRVVFHTDSAKSYKLKMLRVVHDRVVHQKNPVINKSGKTTWLHPKYVKVTLHKLPGGKLFKCNAGTQIIDRRWRYLKERIHANQHARAASATLRTMPRAAQHQCWFHKEDMWLQTGGLMKWSVSQ